MTDTQKPTPPGSGNGNCPPGGTAPCPPGSVTHPITMRVVFDNGTSSWASDPALTFLNVSNMETTDNLPGGFVSNADGSADVDNFKVDINDPQATGSSLPAAKVKLEAMKPGPAGFVPFAPPRVLQVECQQVEGASNTPTNRFRSKYLRLVTDTVDLHSSPTQCLLADWDPSEPAVEILDQIVRVTYDASDGSQIVQDLPIGNPANQRRIRLALHVVRGTPGVAGSGNVTVADAQTRVQKWFRRSYAQAEAAPILTAAVNEVDPPRNMLVVANNSGANATGNANNFTRFFIRDIAGVTYTVQAGDSISLIANRHQGASWQTIYNHARNAGFRALRPNPNVIEVGDRIFIPASGGRVAVVYSPSANDSPGTTAGALLARINTATELAASSFVNAPRPGDPRGSVDILVRTTAGALVTLEDELSNDTTQTLTIARVAITPFLVSGNNIAGGFSSHNIGSPEQRSLVRNYRAANNQLEAFVLDTIRYDDPPTTFIRGRSCIPMSFSPAAQQTNLPLRYSIYMAGNTMGPCTNTPAGDSSDQNPFTFPHEAGHAIMDVFHATLNNQFMRSGTSGTNAVNASKRIYDSNVNFPGVGNVNQITRLRTLGNSVLAGW